MLCDLLPFGEMVDGVLQIKNSFSFECKSIETSGCVLVEALSCYIGEKAPRIRLKLTVKGQEKPFYTSHSYLLGRFGEYTRNQWRTPPLFLPEIVFTIHIEIPEGTVLYTRDFSEYERLISFGVTEFTEDYHCSMGLNLSVK